MADGRGGARRGAGRKPKEITEIRNKALVDASEDAAYALGYIISLLQDDKTPKGLRADCAKEVMDRVWGKATQRNENVNEGDVNLVIEYVNDWRQAE